MCSAISQAAIYGTIHFAVAVGKLIAEEFSVVKSQSAVAVGSFWEFRKFTAVLDANHLYAFNRSPFAAGFIQDIPDHISILYHADHLHLALTLGTDQWINLIYLLYQPRPISTEFLRRQVGIDKRRHIIFLVCLPSHATRFVTVIAVIPDHLLVFAGDMRCQLREPIQSINEKT